MEVRKSSCTCDNNERKRVIYSCSGIGSNVGQLANTAACRLTLEGFGNGSCLAGIGGGIDKLVRVGNEADERIVIDGCPVGCARKIMDDKRLTINRYVLITELGIVKTPGPAFNENDVQTVIDAVRNPLQ
jgi:uncharacterized metal-binding protein